MLETFVFEFHFKQLLLRSCEVDFVKIYNVCARKKAIIKAAKRIFNSDEICRSYCNFYFGVSFWNTVYLLFSPEIYCFDKM